MYLRQFVKYISMGGSQTKHKQFEKINFKYERTNVDTLDDVRIY